MGQKKSKEPEPQPDPNDFRGQLCYSYKKNVLPLEKYIDFDFFYGAPLDDAEFNARPSVLLVGGYSVGKTSLIEFLIDQQYPGMRIGPEPTTDAFTVVMYDQNVRVIPGMSLISEAAFPYKSLEKFGSPFLAKLSGATCPAPLLKTLTIIDTPGILAGEKQKGRGYDFEAVVSYLADKVDVILLIFDPHKLDIPDEIKNVIIALQRNEEKIRIVLNKADSVSAAELNRVRGALMWGLGKAMKYRAEIPQVFTGSFWKKPLKQKEYRDIFEEDQKLLMNEMVQMTRTTDVRRLNDVAKRARLARVHSYIVDRLRQNLAICGVETSKALLIKNLDTVIFPKVVRKNRTITFGDLPNVDYLRAKFTASVVTQWPRLNPIALAKVEEFFKSDFPRLYNILPPDAKTERAQIGVLGQPHDILSMEEEFAMEWKGVMMAASKSDWKEKFRMLSKGRGYLHPSDAKEFFAETGLPRTVLNDLWRLADVDGDNRINENEFFLLCYLMERKKQHKPVPTELPPNLRPPSARPPPSQPSQSLRGSGRLEANLKSASAPSTRGVASTNVSPPKSFQASGKEPPSGMFTQRSK